MDVEAAELLVVCKANLCRSPVAAQLLADRLGEQGLAAVVRSRGLLPSGMASPERYVEICAERGIELEAHRSAELAPGDLGGADLVLPMTRELLRELVVREPTCWPKAFTLRELVRRGVERGPKLAGEDLRGYLERLGEGRERRDLLGSSREDDVADPVELGTVEEIREVLDDLATLCAQAAQLLAGAPVAPDASTGA